MSTQMGDSILKYLYSEPVYMAVESEWGEATNIMINQEEKSAER